MQSKCYRLGRDNSIEKPRVESHIEMQTKYSTNFCFSGNRFSYLLTCFLIYLCLLLRRYKLLASTTRICNIKLAQQSPAFDN